MHIKFLSENLKGSDHLKYLCVDGRMLQKCILKKKYGGMMQTGFNCLRTVSKCEHL